MRLKLSVYDILIITIAIFSLTTLTNQLLPSFLSLNRILGAIICVIVLWMYLRRARKADILFLFVLIALLVISTIFAQDMGMHIEDAIYFTATVLILWKIFDPKISTKINQALKRNSDFLFLIVLANCFILLIGFLINSCYSSSWDGHYYRGFAYSEHSLCCAVCMTLAFALYACTKKPLLLLGGVLAICSWAILQSGARVYLVSLIVILIAFYKYYIAHLKIKGIVLFVAVILFIIILLSSNIITKFFAMMNNEYISPDEWTALTSGRWEFWWLDLQAFAQFNPFNMLFGHGFDYVYLVNQQGYGHWIWAHNDFIDVLLSVGIIGTIIYFLAFFKSVRILLKKSKKIMSWLVIFYFLFVAIINGLFIYQHYLYSFVVLYIFVFFGDSNTQELKKIRK